MPGCAVGSDGSLLDESKIDFFHDADDDIPISGPSRTLSAASSLSSVTSSVGTLDKLLSTREPATKVAGIRHTTRTTRPSAKVRDPENAEAIGQKRKTDNIIKTRCVTRKVVDDSDSDHASNRSSSPPPLKEVSDSDDDSMNGASGDEISAAYNATRLMGETDRQVCFVTIRSLYGTDGLQGNAQSLQG